MKKSILIFFSSSRLDSRRAATVAGQSTSVTSEGADDSSVSRDKNNANVAKESGFLILV